MWLQPGTYTLAISANGAATGSYAFRLLSLAERTPIALGEAQSITLNPGNVTQAFRFDAGAGNRLFFDHIGGSTDPYWRLIDPRGQVVFGPSRLGDLEEPPPPLTGTYPLLVEIGRASCRERVCPN